MMLLSTITTDTVDAWTTIILRMLDALGLVAIAAVAVWSKVKTAAIAERVDRHGEKLTDLQSNMTSLALATPSPGATPPVPVTVPAVVPPPPPTVKFTVDYEKLATMVADKVRKPE